MHQLPFTGSKLQSLVGSGGFAENESESGVITLRDTTGSPFLLKHGEVFSV